MIRKIIHIDMDAFYASVEQRDNPSLQGKPVIVGGLPDQRGVVSAASYEARKFGIRSAMATKTALKLCPHLKIVFPNFKKYVSISKKLMDFYYEYTDFVEPLSLDECYLDVTSNKQNIEIATEIGKKLKERIKKELNLTASVGIAPNKLLAKIASDYKKPDGIFVIKPHQVEGFIKNLDIKNIWGVGKVTYKKMEELKIKTCSDLQKYSMLDLIDQFGIFGETLYYYARGIDDRKIVNTHEAKSIGAETTFNIDSNNLDFIKKELYHQVERVYQRIIHKNIKVKTITLKAKYADFNSITRSRTIDWFTDNINEIFKVCTQLIKETEIGKKKIRLIGVSLTNFNNKGGGQRQLDLL